MFKSKKSSSTDNKNVMGWSPISHNSSAAQHLQTLNHRKIVVKMQALSKTTGAYSKNAF